jgi:class 3 adenylate cyclase
LGEVTIARMNLVWKEPSANWIEGLWFEPIRMFENGPFISMATRAEVVDRGPASGLKIEVSFVPRNLVGYFLARRLIAAFQGEARQLLDSADQLIRAEKPVLFNSDFQFAHAAIAIRIGINSGSSISVNLNDRLDYYGKTVNFAARLESEGGPGDISMSQEFVADPAVAENLAGFDIRKGEVLPKGWREPVMIHQINP